MQSIDRQPPPIEAVVQRLAARMARDGIRIEQRPLPAAISQRRRPAAAFAALLPPARRSEAPARTAARQRRFCAGDGRAHRGRPQPDGRRAALRPQAGGIYLPEEPRGPRRRHHRHLADACARQVAPHRAALSPSAWSAKATSLSRSFMPARGCAPDCS